MNNLIIEKYNESLVEFGELYREKSLLTDGNSSALDARIEDVLHRIEVYGAILENIKRVSEKNKIYKLVLWSYCEKSYICTVS